MLVVKLEALLVPGGDMGQQMAYPPFFGSGDEPIQESSPETRACKLWQDEISQHTRTLKCCARMVATNQSEAYYLAIDFNDHKWQSL